MNIRRINLKKERLETMLPEWVLTIDDEPIVYAAHEDGNMVGLAIFEEGETANGEIRLRFIYTFPDYQDRGMAKDLMRRCRDVLRTAGYRYITVRFRTDLAETLLRLGLFSGIGFRPLSLHTRFIAYPAEEVLRSEFTRMLEKCSNALKKPVAADRLNDGQIRSVERAEKRLHLREENEQDRNLPDYVFFHKEEASALVWVYREGDSIFLKDYYICRKEEQRQCMLSILALLIEMLGREPDVKKLYLQTASNALYTVFQKNMGNPLTELFISEYVCML